MTARGANQQRSDIPACEELLPLRQAAAAMGEPFALILLREVQGSTRTCDYTGAKKRALPTHSILVSWGPYTPDARKQLTSSDGIVCRHPRSPACTKLVTAFTLRPNLKSFYGVEKALAQSGATKRPQGNAFDVGNNPAFVWLPGKDLAPLDQLAWALVYDVKSAHLLVTACGNNSARTADYRCAIDAAEYVYINVS